MQWRGQTLPSAEVAANLAKALTVVVGRVLGEKPLVNTDDFDPEADRRIRELSNLAPDDRKVGNSIMDALIRDASVRNAYVA